jgi:hypothetical protein
LVAFAAVAFAAARRRALARRCVVISIVPFHPSSIVSTEYGNAEIASVIRFW